MYLLDTGTSADRPNWTAVYPDVVAMSKHTSRRAASGRSSVVPNCVVVTCHLLLSIMNQVPVYGLRSAMSSLSSPTKAPACGISPACPKCCEVTCPLLLFRMNQVPLDGRKT